jgi:TPR repeat protein
MTVFMDIQATTRIPHDVIDFRIERLRRALLKADARAALAVAKHYAEAGLAEAQFVLAGILASTDQPEDLEAAKGWYKAAARQGHIEAAKTLWRATVINAGSGAIDRSLEDVILAADLGDYLASAALIVVYGQKPDAPVPNMLAYLERHVGRGDSYAQDVLALAYDYGHHGLPRNPEKAFELYTQAALQGNPHAQCAVGICYAHGLGVQQNDEQAVHWYQQAASRGSAQAQCNLGVSYEIGRKPLGKSMQEANRWYRRSAMRDFADAQYNLGLSYQRGRELPQDDEIANRWFARAAKQGMAGAQCSLGFSYERGRGVAQDFAKAAELYSAAAKSGDAQAQQNYAYLLENGLGVEKNLPEAVHWYRTAADQGLGSAQSCLAFMYETGTGVEKGLDAALGHYQRAAAQNDKRGIQGVARIKWQQERAEAAKALNALEARLKGQDAAYENKKALLVPILQPLFKQLPPAKWAAAYEEAYAGVRLPAEGTIRPQPESASQRCDDRGEPETKAAPAIGALKTNVLSRRAPLLCRWWMHKRRVVNIAVERRGAKKLFHRHSAYVLCLRCGRAESYNGTPLSAADVAERHAAARRASRSFADEGPFTSPDPNADLVIVTRAVRPEMLHMRRISRHSGYILPRRGLLGMLNRWPLWMLDHWLQRRWNVRHAKRLFRHAGLTVPRDWDEITMIVAAASIDPVLAEYYNTTEETRKLRQRCQAQQQ